MAEAAQSEPNAVTQEDEVFLPVNLASMRIDTVPQFDLFFRPAPGQPLVLYCERNTPFSREARRRLQENRVGVLYIRGKHRGQYHRYLADHLDGIVQDPSIPIREKASVLYDAAMAVVEDTLDKPSRPANIQRSKEVVNHTVDFMTSEQFSFEDLLRTLSSDYYLYTHSVNVVGYSVTLAMAADIKDRASLRELANGALVHDVGKSRIAEAIIHKAGPLTTYEWEQMQRHPELGHQLISESGRLGEIALDIILHHHERMDATGYPHHLHGDELSLYVRVVSIADVFDALTSDRYHQKGQTSFEALSTMQRTMPQQVDTDLFRLFVEIFGGKKGK